MQSVLIVCGAGASSTFLASRLRSIAKSRGLAFEFTAASDSELRTRLHTTNALLVGPHLAATFEAIEAEAAVFGVPAILLPSTAFGPDGAEQALALLTSQLASQPDQSKESHG